jgi:hypothetical protein
MLLNIAVLKNLHLTAPEREYLHQTCPYFQPAYLDYLEKLRLHPEEQVTVDFVLKQRAERAQDGKEDGQEGGGNQDEEDDEDLGLIELGVKGLWRECILYEVPLMAIRKSCFSASFSPCDMADPISVVCQPLLYRTALQSPKDTSSTQSHTNGIPPPFKPASWHLKKLIDSSPSLPVTSPLASSAQDGGGVTRYRRTSLRG